METEKLTAKGENIVKKILVIEDETALRELLEMWLTSEGYEVLGRANGVDGVEAAFCFGPDLILCDISMPRLDGYGVCAQVHANEATASIPFIFVTAKTTPEDILKGTVLGADHYLTKPFNLDNLSQVIQSSLVAKATQKQALSSSRVFA